MCEHCASTDGARRAQNCALYTSVCFVVSVPLFAMWFRLFMSVCRSQMFVNMRCRIHSLYTTLLGNTITAAHESIPIRITMRSNRRLPFQCILSLPTRRQLRMHSFLWICNPLTCDLSCHTCSICLGILWLFPLLSPFFSWNLSTFHCRCPSAS